MIDPQLVKLIIVSFITGLILGVALGICIGKDIDITVVEEMKGGEKNDD